MSEVAPSLSQGVGWNSREDLYRVSVEEGVAVTGEIDAQGVDRQNYR
jgi:hypothetical protein